MNKMENDPLYTKKDFAAWMHGMLDPLKPLYSKGCARLSLSETGARDPAAAAGAEGFAQPLWALAPFWAGGGQDAEFEAIYQTGIANGTTPESEEYWGSLDEHDRRFGAMAALAFGMLLAPEVLWEPLEWFAKAHVANWLYDVNEYRISECGGPFLTILVNIALKKRGMPYDVQRLEQALEDVDVCYLGGGWYREGRSARPDCRTTLGFHYGGLLYSTVMDDDDPERCSTYRERARLFAQDLIYRVSLDKTAPSHSCGLTCHFGQAAFWAAYVYAGLDGIPLGIVKGILTRHLAWWASKKTAGRNEMPALDCAYSNPILSGPGDAASGPYGGMTAFLCLALPDGHPFWSQPALPTPELDALAGGVQEMASEAPQRCGTFCGGLAEGTRIRMADGSERPVQAIRRGDRLQGQDGVQLVKGITCTYGGNRAVLELFSAGFGGVVLTGDIPVLTEDGWTRAEQLCEGARVVTETGGGMLESAAPPYFRGADDGAFYAITLQNGEHALIANGVVVGDETRRRCGLGCP